MSDGRGFGVYIHWPFCLAKCPYCDFNSHVQDNVPVDRWRRALLQELAHFAEKTAHHQVDTLFFGGGTPSLMPPDLVADLINAVKTHWPVAADIEITLEANPTSVEAAALADVRQAGVNRLSLGVQALNDADLKRLGRNHSAGEARDALALAKTLFPRVSFDLIYARSGQTLISWAAELEEALPLAGGHISLYQLTIEPGTAYFQSHKRGRLILPDDDIQADMYQHTIDAAAAAGYSAYEISNLAKPGEECRHNLIYWRYGHYAGIGPGAHGRIPSPNGRQAVTQKRKPADWLTAVASKGHGTDEMVPLDDDTVAVEMLMMGLRLSEGLSRAAFTMETGFQIEHWCRPGSIELLQEDGLVALTPVALAATPKGRPLLNAIIGQLVPD